MFDIYIKDFNRNGQIISTETLIQTVPAASEDKLRFISPIVKCEMGKVEGFDFSIEPGTPFYDAFLQMKTFIRVVYDGSTIFYGRVLTIDNSGFRGTRKVRCEGPLSFLMDSPVEGVEETKRKTISTFEYIQQLIDNHNAYINNEANKRFAVGNVPGHYYSVNAEQQVKNDSRKFGSDSWTDTKSALEDLRSHYGGFLRTRAGAIGSPIYLDWMNHYFNPITVSQKIEVGKNVLDISNITEIDNVFTAIIPIGRKSVSKSDTGNSSSSQENLYIDGKILRVPDIVSYFDSKGVSLNSGYHTRADYQNAVSKYGMIIKTVSLTDSTTKEKLYSDACEWIRNNYQGEVTKFTIKALDMHMIKGITGVNTSKIMVGDRVEITYPVGKEDGSFVKRTTVQTCLSITYDLYHPENTSYTFGIPANILTKTYGIRKKAGSVSSPTTQKNTNPGINPGRDIPWIDVAGGWLMDHLQYYNPPSKASGSQYYPYPMDDSYANYMYGPQLYNPSARTLIYAEPGAVVDGRKSWHGSIRSFDNFDYETIEKYHVCEYVLYEYGIDIRTQLTYHGESVTYPGMTVDSKGNMTFWKTAYNQVTGQFEKAKSAVALLGEIFSDHALDIYSPDGQQIHSYIDADGDWHYYYIDPKTHERVPTKIRDLTITAVQDDNFIGSMVTEGYGYRDAEGEPHIYKFGQAIENWYNGEVVIAHVDGDVIRVGSEKTQWSSSVAQKVNGVFLGATEYIVDPITGEKSAILIGQAGQASYRARYVDDPNSPYYGQYVQDPFGDVILTGDGFWDEKNLAIKGGVYTVQDPVTFKYTSYVKSSQLVIGDRNTSTTVLKALRDSNVITGDKDSPQSLVANSIYVEDVNALNVRCGAIETNYLKTSLLKTTIANMGLVSMSALSVSGSKSGEGTIYASRSVTSPHYWYGATGMGLEDGINDIKIVPPSGNSNTYTLQKFKLTTMKWDDVGTFSRATTLKGEWSSGTYTVSATPQGNKNSTTLQYLSKNAPGESEPSEITRSGKTITQRHYMMYGPDEDHLYHTGFSQPVVIDATLVYNHGWSSANRNVSLPNVSSASSFTIKWPSGSADVQSTRTYTLTDDGNNKVIARYLEGETYYTIASYTHNKYNSAWSAANGKVSLPGVSSGASFTFKWPNGTVGGQSTRTYSLTDDGNNKVIARYLEGETYYTIASYTHNKYNTGWSNANRKVSLPGVSSDASFTFKWPSGSADVQSTRTYSLTDDGNNKVIARYLEGETYYTIASYTHNKYNSGWSAANGKVSLPGVSSGASFTFKWPNGTVGGQSSRTYSLTDDGNNKVIARYLEGETYYTIASYTHNKYNSGWSAANRQVSLPGVSSASSFTFSWPNGTVGGQSSRTYSITDDGNNAIKVQYLEGETYHTIASYAHYKYNSGWAAANGKVYLPGISFGSSFTFGWPNGTVGGQSTRTYSLADFGNDAVIVRYLEGETFYTVAAYQHNKYTDGQNSVRNRIGNYGTVTSNGTYKASDNNWEGISEIRVDVRGGGSIRSIGIISRNSGSGAVEGYTWAGSLSAYDPGWLKIELSDGTRVYYDVG